MTSLFHVGKYAAFVWPAYGISFAGIAAAILVTLRGYLQAGRKLNALERKP